MPILVFNSGNKVYLDSMKIHTMYLSAKLSYYHLRLYTVEKWVGLISYMLKLPLSMKRLHLVFHIVKLTTIAEVPILGWCTLLLLDPVVVNEKEK